MGDYDLVVFDLDLTLWPFRVDDCTFPFKAREDCITDYGGKELILYPDTIGVLKVLHDCGYKLAVASRIEQICRAFQLLVIFDIVRYFRYIEIYPVSKTVHFKILSGKSGIGFDRMIFFDDDQRNIRSVSRLGVRTEHVVGGITKQNVTDVLKCSVH